MRKRFSSACVFPTICGRPWHRNSRFFRKPPKSPTISNSPWTIPWAIHISRSLKNLHPPIPPGVPRQEIWLTSSSLFALAGTYIHRQKIESKESLTEDDYRKILRSDYPYTAVVKDEKLESLINRDTVALLVARNQVATSSA